MVSFIPPSFNVSYFSSIYYIYIFIGVIKNLLLNK
jgi:hypothetical protein